jgi:plastocyanin
MRHLVALALVYAVVAALIVPSSLLAAEDGTQSAGEEAAQGQRPEDARPDASADAGPGAPGGGPPGAAEPSAPDQGAAPEQSAAEPAPATQASPGEPAPAPEAAAPVPAAAQAEAEPAPDKPPRARAASPGSVTIKDFSFSPASITVNVGEAVTWSNVGPTGHSATASDGSFDTGVFPKGQSRSHTFQEAGTFAYICTPHPFMKGTVKVLAASSGGGGGSGGGGADSGDTGSGSSDSSGSADTGSGESLPKSGADAGALALLGLLLVALGAATRRRAASQAPAHPGRIGW